MTKKSELDLPKIGYLYHYPRLDHPADKFRLDIFISAVPTEQHFDVLRARLSVNTPKGAIPERGVIEHLTIEHPWNFQKTARVCAGVVVMEDRKGKKEEAFTFGGQLTIEPQEFQTVCSLVSSAPILEISETTSAQRLFIDELEVLLAKRRVAYSDHYEYENQLSEADPFELYLACVNELILKFEPLPHKNEEYLELLMYLHSQEHRLQAAGLFRDPIPKLDEIFKV